MKRDNIIIGSRGSKLAVIYAEKVKSKLSKFYSGKIEIKKITTTGDQNQSERLSSMGGKGLFSTNIENELLENKIDIAVHALKDMPSFDTKGLLLISKIPFNSLFEAFIIASFILSGVASFSVTSVRSIKETFGVGTLIAVPSNLPFKLGRTKLIALAAPVEVGIIAPSVDLALLKSLCNVSNNF